jgi:ornithine decarboxylase
MSSKIARFLADHDVATPALVLDVDRVAENYGAIKRALPHAAVYYAVKANPAQPILRRLAAMGSNFDAASMEEIEMCLEAGAAPAAISFGNTVKKAKAIARAHALGVPMFAFDSAEELDKLVSHAPGAQVYCRLTVDNAGADWPLSKKFGCDVAVARTLMLRAAEMGMEPMGLSFHVGSQQTGTAAYEAAIAKAAMLFTDLKEAGLKMRMLNLGGGFPVKYRDEVPGIDDFGVAIGQALARAFGNAIPDTLVEPGRFLVGDAGVLASEVVLVSRRDPDSAVRWVYLDIGRFGGLAETEGEAIKYRIETPHDGQKTGPVVVAGPTCDGTDVMYEKSNYRMPLALTAGDQVLLHGAGAYITTYAAQYFNGFKPPAEHYI